MRDDPQNGAPLYGMLDALNACDRFGRVAAYGQPIALAPGIVVTFFDAGHILGSASILFGVEEGGRKRRRVLFSGDLGNAGRPLLRPPANPPQVDAVIMETTYGDRLHKPLAPSIEEFYQAISATFQRGGNVVIPTFALERAQELLYVLRQGREGNQLPPAMQVFLDSPMAISATEIFERYPEGYGPAVAELFRDGRDPFSLPGLHFARETADSAAINRVTGGGVIMAGSGMCTGGRIRHHLRHNLWRPQASVIFVGYAAQGTLARKIIDGAKQVEIFGETIAVRAEIHTINGFSAHADQAELLAWHAQTHAERTILVHGEAKRCAPSPTSSAARRSRFRRSATRSNSEAPASGGDQEQSLSATPIAQAKRSIRGSAVQRLVNSARSIASSTAIGDARTSICGVSGRRRGGPRSATNSAAAAAPISSPQMTSATLWACNSTRP